METPAETTKSESTGRSADSKKSSNGSLRIGRLAIKELRETLRDRRTIITLILMPLLVYPVLSMVFRTFLASNAELFQADNKPVKLNIIYDSDLPKDKATRLLTVVHSAVSEMEAEALKEKRKDAGDVNDDEDVDAALADGEAEQVASNSVGLLSKSAGQVTRFAPFKSHQWFICPKDQDLEGVLDERAADIGIFFERDPDLEMQVGKIRLVVRDDARSQMAKRYLEAKLKAFNKEAIKRRLQSARIPAYPAVELLDSVTVSKEGEAGEDNGFSIASLIPLVLVLMTITGAVYPAIDLTAGEKERGTLETLMAAPIPRIGILLSKFTAVMTVAVLTAMLNMVGMAATIWAFRLDQFLAGSEGFTLLVIFKIFLLLVLFAAFFSALLLVVSSYARSFKEAQAYLIPIILLAMGPCLIAMTPGLRLSGPWAVMPMINILLLARDVIQNQVEIVPACIAIGSTLIYTWFAIMLAAKIFGSDSILYSSHGSFGEMFSRPKAEQRVVPVSATVFCVTLLFPINFLLIGFLGRMGADSAADLTLRFLTMGLFTILSFLVLPLVIAKHQKTPTLTGFGLQPTRIVFFVAAILLGLSLWPIVMWMISQFHDVYGAIAGVAKQDAWRERLVSETTAQVARVRMVSPFVIALCLAILPAVCEEWFFRGMLQRALLKSKKVWIAILVSSVIFGLFHVLSNSVIALDRLLPTTLVGLVLGYIAYKSNSILPGIFLHALHNGSVSFLAYYQPQLSKLSWFPEDTEQVPFSWVAIAFVVVGIGATILLVSKRQPDGVSLDESPVPQTVANELA